MAQASLSSPQCFSLLNASAAKTVRPCAFLRLPNSSSSSRISVGPASPFKNGSPLVFWAVSRKRKLENRALSVPIRCEQGAKGSNGLDVWLGRFAMVGFATAITIEVATGKGLLELPDSAISASLQSIQENVNDERRLSLWHYLLTWPFIVYLCYHNFGFVTTVPTLALVVTALVGVLTAFFIFQSASRD